MTCTGPLRKMRVVAARPIVYGLRLGDGAVDHLEKRIGSPIRFRFEGEIRCVACGARTRKSYAQGFCFRCMRTAPEASECIIRPERCRGHLGEGRDPEWEARHHVQPHLVYLALASAVKVGVTRATEIPTRWIDQGAGAAIRLARTPNRHLAGRIEVALKAHVTDRTNWRRMLRGEVPDGVDLVARKRELLTRLPEELTGFADPDDEVVRLVYPVERAPEKVSSVTFDREPEIGGVLAGIRGQYLIFDDGRVLNIRRHTGYVVTFSED